MSTSVDIDALWPERREFKEKTAQPPANRTAPRQPSISQRAGRIEPFIAKDGYINIFGRNPFNKEAADD